MRVFFHPNGLVSAYAARGICTDLVRVVLAEHELLTGEVNLEELRRVLSERFRAPAGRLDAIESELRAETVVPRPTEPSTIVALREAMETAGGEGHAMGGPRPTVASVANRYAVA